MKKVEMMPQSTVIAADDGIVRICGMGISIIILQEAGDRVTLGDCLRLAEEKGFDKDNDLALLVVAESEHAGAVYKYGNHLHPKTKEWIFEKVGDTVGYA